MPLLELSQLCCPLDGLPMQRDAGQWRCPSGHSFDIARQGHVHLLPVQFKKSRDPGDSAGMIAARRDFLDSGAYAPIANALIDRVQNALADIDSLAILDAGCGDGYYLDALCRHLDRPGRAITATGVDISKWAVQACRRRNRNINALVASNRQIPLPEESQDLILCAFGFPVYPEFYRLLKPGGLLIMLDPDRGHLRELRQQLYAELRESPPPSLAAAEACGFQLVDSLSLNAGQQRLNSSQIRQLLQMTPHGHRASPAARDRVAALEALAVSIELRLCRLRKIPAT